VIKKLNLLQPENGTAVSVEGAIAIANSIGYPVVVRPSYVLGGRAMEIVYNESSLKKYMEHAVKASPEHPILIDCFLQDAIELDVDAISDGTDVVIGGIMEHIEEAGIHSGDSACSLPPNSVDAKLLTVIEEQTKALARELNVIGLLNIQFAVKDSQVYLIEVNPRASRTVPFVSKATGIPLAKLAARVMGGKTLKELGFTETVHTKHVSVKESVFPFNKFSEVDTLLGPEMKSTGEVMGIGSSFGAAFAKAQMATGIQFPKEGGTVFISVKDSDKPSALKFARDFSNLGFDIIATRGTANYFNQNDLKTTAINKFHEGPPHIVEAILTNKVTVVVNTVFGEKPTSDSFSLRRACLTQNISYCTTIRGAQAFISSLKSLKESGFSVSPLQDYLK
jgi:carbamoyl-phosphate synthase large subunit